MYIIFVCVDENRNVSNSHILSRESSRSALHRDVFHFRIYIPTYFVVKKFFALYILLEQNSILDINCTLQYLF